MIPNYTNFTVALQDILVGLRETDAKGTNLLDDAAWNIEQAIDRLNEFEEVLQLG